MDNPLVLWFLIGLILGLIMGMYVGNKKFRATVNKMIRGKERNNDDEDEEEPEDDRYREHNRRYGDGPYRNSDRPRR